MHGFCPGWNVGASFNLSAITIVMISYVALSWLPSLVILLISTSWSCIVFKKHYTGGNDELNKTAGRTTGTEMSRLFNRWMAHLHACRSACCFYLNYSFHSPSYLVTIPVEQTFPCFEKMRVQVGQNYLINYIFHWEFHQVAWWIQTASNE